MSLLDPEALRERARKAVTDWHRQQFPHSTLITHETDDYIALEEHILTAFTALVAEARREQIEQDKKAVCWMCREGWVLASEDSDQHCDPDRHARRFFYLV